MGKNVLDLALSLISGQEKEIYYGKDGCSENHCTNDEICEYAWYYSSKDGMLAICH